MEDMGISSWCDSEYPYRSQQIKTQVNSCFGKEFCDQANEKCDQEREDVAMEVWSHFPVNVVTFGHMVSIQGFRAKRQTAPEKGAVWRFSGGGGAVEFLPEAIGFGRKPRRAASPSHRLQTPGSIFLAAAVGYANPLCELDPARCRAELRDAVRDLRSMPLASRPKTRYNKIRQ